MGRIRVTQVLPFLLPLRIKQKKLFFYTKMRNDKNTYASTQEELTSRYMLISEASLLVNKDSGQDIKYQYNKVDNLKLASQTINRLLIQPQETFSFWHAIKESYKLGTYKDGLMLVDNKVKTTSAGGLCQISQLLYWVFVHSDLSIEENYSHTSQAFYVPKNNIPMGMESTVSEGWQDLRVKNNTNKTYQIDITFDELYMYVSLYCSVEDNYKYRIIEKDNYFYSNNSDDYYHNKIYKQKILNDQLVAETLLKENNILLKYNYRDYLAKEEI